MGVRKSVYREGVAFEKALLSVLSEDYETRDATLIEQLNGVDFFVEERPFQVKYDIKARNRLAVEYKTLRYGVCDYYLWGVPYLKTVFVFRRADFNACFEKWLGRYAIGAMGYYHTTVTSPTNKNTKVEILCVPIDDILKDYAEQSGARANTPPPTLHDRFDITWQDIWQYMPPDAKM